MSKATLRERLAQLEALAKAHARGPIGTVTQIGPDLFEVWGTGEKLTGAEVDQRHPPTSDDTIRLICVILPEFQDGTHHDLDEIVYR